MAGRLGRPVSLVFCSDRGFVGPGRGGGLSAWGGVRPCPWFSFRLRRGKVVGRFSPAGSVKR